MQSWVDLAGEGQKASAMRARAMGAPGAFVPRAIGMTFGSAAGLAQVKGGAALPAKLRSLGARSGFGPARSWGVLGHGASPWSASKTHACVLQRRLHELPQYWVFDVSEIFFFHIPMGEVLKNPENIRPVNVFDVVRNPWAADIAWTICSDVEPVEYEARKVPDDLHQDAPFPGQVGDCFTAFDRIDYAACDLFDRGQLRTLSFQA